MNDSLSEYGAAPGPERRDYGRELTGLGDKVGDLSNRVSVLQVKLEGHSIRLGQVEVDVSKTRDEVANMQACLAKMDERLIGIEKENKSIGQDVRDMRTIVSATKDLFNAHDLREHKDRMALLSTGLGLLGSVIGFMAIFIFNWAVK